MEASKRRLPGTPTFLFYREQICNASIASRYVDETFVATVSIYFRLASTAKILQKDHTDRLIDWQRTPFYSSIARNEKVNSESPTRGPKVRATSYHVHLPFSSSVQAMRAMAKAWKLGPSSFPQR
jgi:hypothetical protein